MGGSCTIHAMGVLPIMLHYARFQDYGAAKYYVTRLWECRMALGKVK